MVIIIPSAALKMVAHVAADSIHIPLPKVKFAGPEGQLDMTGPAFRDHVLNQLCSWPWPPRFATQLADMFKDIALTSEQLLFTLQKLIRTMPQIEVGTF